MIMTLTHLCGKLAKKMRKMDLRNEIVVDLGAVAPDESAVTYFRGVKVAYALTDTVSCETRAGCPP